MTAGSLTAAAGRDQEQAGTRVTWLDVARLAGLALQMGLILLVIQAFELESRTFFRIVMLATGGFLVNALLPMRHRLSWFVAVSFVGIGLAFGITGALWLVGTGLLLIAICHLPIAFRWRVGLLLLTGVGLAAMRAGYVHSPWPISVWPILGSMFMFRLIMYMYSLRYDESTPSIPRTLGYFFMLPNVTFPLFPLVDYKVFERTYYETESWAVYQRGVQWIARGLLHLVLYRMVYYYLAMDPADVADLGGLLQHFASTFLLYLRVSGQFHVVVGMLHLFGFHLPETHHLYYLSSSFTDLWRRTNIYWKDFIMKYVYYPAYFRYRRRGAIFGIVVSMGIVFILTWLFHSYQWFWLRGSFPLTATDGLFWFVMTAFLLYHLLREAKQGRERVLTRTRTWSLRRGLSAVAMFATISALWALWDSPSVGDFFALFSVAGKVTAQQLFVIGSIIVAYVGIAGYPWGVRTLADRQKAARTPFWRGPAIQTTGLLAGMIVLTAAPVLNLLGTGPGHFVRSLQEGRLNARDAAMLQRGYYEQLINVERYNNQLWDVYQDKPEDWVRLTETPVYRALPTLLGGELVPASSIEFKGAPLTTNAWGMRDRDYTEAKPAGTVRLALLGPSDVMGSGVPDSSTFDNITERRLNSELGTDDRHYEILNFSVVSFSLVQQVLLLEDRVWRFSPDMIVLTYHPASDARTAFQYLANAVRDSVPIEDPVLQDIVRRSGVKRGDAQPVAFRKMRPLGYEIVEWCFQRISDSARARGVPAVLLVLDVPKEPSMPRDRLIIAAQRAGFMIQDIRDAYGSRAPESLILAEWDKHPNEEGHRLLADRWFKQLTAGNLIQQLGSGADTVAGRSLSEA
ncbi:MAG: hypothetical protein AB7I33_17250, partial [Gemmatimonadales bacterium]